MNAGALLVFGVGAVCVLGSKSPRGRRKKKRVAGKARKDSLEVVVVELDAGGEGKEGDGPGGSPADGLNVEQVAREELELDPQMDAVEAVEAAFVAEDRRPAEPLSQGHLPPHGMVIMNGDLKIVSWDLWMEFAPQAIQISREEVGDDPYAIAANVFRRLFPDRAWPPYEDSPLAEKWNEIVRAIGRAIGKPIRPQLEIMA